MYCPCRLSVSFSTNGTKLLSLERRVNGSTLIGLAAYPASQPSRRACPWAAEGPAQTPGPCWGSTPGCCWRCRPGPGHPHWRTGAWVAPESVSACCPQFWSPPTCWSHSGGRGCNKVWLLLTSSIIQCCSYLSCTVLMGASLQWTAWKSETILYKIGRQEDFMKATATRSNIKSLKCNLWGFWLFGQSQIEASHRNCQAKAPYITFNISLLPSSSPSSVSSGCIIFTSLTPWLDV